MQHVFVSVGRRPAERRQRCAATFATRFERYFDSSGDATLVVLGTSSPHHCWVALQVQQVSGRLDVEFTLPSTPHFELGLEQLSLSSAPPSVAYDDVVVTTQ